MSMTRARESQTIAVVRAEFLMATNPYLMSVRVTALSKILKSPTRILGVMLLVVFAVEVGVMLLLPSIVPTSLGESYRAILDALLLTAISAPVLWWIIVRPLRRIALSEHARSETIVANAGEGVVTVDQDNLIVSFNRAASKLFQVATTEILGRPVQSLIPEYVNEPTPFLELTGVRHDSTTFPIAISVSELPSRSGSSHVVIIRDLTAARRAEDERVAAIRDREALRSQQMATLAQLATGVAHEIRNPLTSIKMLIQVNRDVFRQNGLPSKDLELVEQEIRRMERSVNSLLDYGRPAPAEFGPVSLRKVVEQTQRLIEGRCSAQHIETEVLTPDGDVEVVADRSHIQQLLLNLSLNALDAMPETGRLSFEIARDDGSAIIAVSDTGPGISSEVLDHLFSPFVTTKPDGVGLGLGICRRIAEDHHGQLTGDNLAEGGARFELRLPINPDAFVQEDN
ncbi:MAG: ATP-binding protein [Planctomycetaceae bacterium]